jgi:hypothetical protein
VELESVCVWLSDVLDVGVKVDAAVEGEMEVRWRSPVAPSRSEQNLLDCDVVSLVLAVSEVDDVCVNVAAMKKPTYTRSDTEPFRTVSSLEINPPDSDVVAEGVIEVDVSLSELVHDVVLDGVKVTWK